MHRLSETILWTLRLEVRCHCLFYIDYALREGTYEVEDASEPDAYIIALNYDLLKLDSVFARYLPPAQYHYLLEGLAKAVQSILFFNIRYIKRMNTQGIHKLLRNVTALQQNLYQLVGPNRGKMDLIGQYVDLLLLPRKELLAAIQRQPRKYPVPLYQVILDLVFPEFSTYTSKSPDTPTAPIDPAIKTSYQAVQQLLYTVQHTEPPPLFGSSELLEKSHKMGLKTSVLYPR